MRYKHQWDLVCQNVRVLVINFGTLIIKKVFQFSTNLESRLVIIFRVEYKLNKPNNNIRLFLYESF